MNTECISEKYSVSSTYRLVVYDKDIGIYKC